MATIKQIAELCGISPSAVSRVLNYDETLRVADSTRKRIFEAAESLAYEPRTKNRRQSAWKVGLCYSYSLEEELQDTYYLSMRLALEQHLKVRGFKSRRIAKDARPEAALGLDAVVCLGLFFPQDIEVVRRFHKPLCFLDSSPPGDDVDSVVIEYGQATLQALDCLLALGHRKIGFIGGIDTDLHGRPRDDVRHATFAEHLGGRGLFRPDWVKRGAYTPAAGHRHMGELMAGADRPTAVFVANDDLAIGCYKACSEKGLRIPDDVSLVGFNDIAQAQFLVPPLTSVHLYIQYMGEAAVELVDERLRTARTIGKRVIIPTRLMQRESASPPHP